MLADEPTGARRVRSTSVQIMELLKEISKDRLVIMVTHNPELAEQYSNRIVRLKDGEVVDDTNPYVSEPVEEKVEAQKRNKRRSQRDRRSQRIYGLRRSYLRYGRKAQK